MARHDVGIGVGVPRKAEQKALPVRILRVAEVHQPSGIVTEWVSVEPDAEHAGVDVRGAGVGQERHLDDVRIEVGCRAVYLPRLRKVKALNVLR